jgi:hypothetical protein
MSRYFSDRPATPTVTFTSDATIVDDAGGDAFVGVTCWGSPAFGYLGAVGSDGSTVILRAYNDRKPDLLSEGSEAPSIQVGTPAQLSLDCRGGGSAPTELVLRVNGEEVERAEDPEGLDGFMGVGLWYASERADAVVRWNDSRSQTS